MTFSTTAGVLVLATLLACGCASEDGDEVGGSGGTAGTGTGTGGSGAGGAGSGGGTAPPGLSMRGDPTFDPQALGPEEQLWYERLQASMVESAATVEERAALNDTYTLGRYVGNYYAALLMGLRATGDLGLLDRVVELSQLQRATLSDAWSDGTTDGYLGWQWTADSASSYYGKDTHQMDEAMTHGSVALIAYALDLNRDLDPSYGNEADQWLDYLENHFLAKWIERAGGDPVAAWEDPSSGFYKRLTHPRANQARLGYCLWRMTGDPFYEQRAQVVAADLISHLEINPTVPTAYQWKHQVAGDDEGYQRINYAQYYMRVVLELHLEGFAGYAPSSEMGYYASTFRDVVLTKFGPPYDDMAYRVDGSESTSTNLYGLDGFGRWDPAGTLLEIADQRYSDGSTGVSVAGYALMAVSER